jgi:CHAT domain-containing protein
VKRSELTALVSDLRTRIATRDLGVREPAVRLFQLLLAPAREALSGRSALIIVPDGVLWELPFQALQPVPGRYLIEDRAVSYAASLAVLREIRRSGRPVDRPAPLSLLAFGNPALGAPPTGPSPIAPASSGLAPLPEAERQVHLLGRLYGQGSRVYIGEAAREQRAKAEAGASRILHLATHGVLDDQSPMHSYLVLSQAPPRGDEDGLLEAWEVMNLELNAELVVLSACETGRGRVGPGEGVIGMSWAAFVAGSPATVASLWKVQSQSTTELMVQFHRSLLADPGTPGATPSKAHALQRAALTLLQDSRYRHPFYWAGFVLVGDTAPLRPSAAISPSAPTAR